MALSSLRRYALLVMCFDVFGMGHRRRASAGAGILDIRSMARIGSARHRLGTHGFAIALVSAALCGAAFSNSAAALQPRSDVDVQQQPTSSTQPGQVALDLAELATPAATSDVLRTQGADQHLATVTFDPRLGLPQWVRTTKDAPLWSAADSTATSAASIPAGTSYLKPLGPFGESRVQVYF